jgi:hypothetical protein
MEIESPSGISSSYVTIKFIKTNLIAPQRIAKSDQRVE